MLLLVLYVSRQLEMACFFFGSCLCVCVHPDIVCTMKTYNLVNDESQGDMCLEGDGRCSYEACKGIETDSVNINKQTNKQRKEQDKNKGGHKKHWCVHNVVYVTHTHAHTHTCMRTHTHALTCARERSVSSYPVCLQCCCLVVAVFNNSVCVRGCVCVCV